MTEGKRDPQDKRVQESNVEMVELVLPNDTNQLGNLLGGRLMHWIDIVAAMAATRHSNHVCVTAAVDELSFLHPIKLGELVTLKSSVNRVFNTSMEVGVKVFSENPLTGERKHSNSAYLTFVSIDRSSQPIKSVSVVPESLEEKRRYEQAQVRREQRLKHREETKRIWQERTGEQG
ncbi:MAG TPA: acyl-CoA thioesterase [Candidatus Acidoferrales bacterium]|nr:acyl-CoA thioesterase [Candidatus Acidoferrales bacterium]